ncbi:MAG: DNA translocase FtsK [bacterium]|nr:DNA translocase FtsK [bacterium]
MSRRKAAVDEAETPKRRGTKFVPLEDVPEPGLSQRARELLALGICGFALYLFLSLATFRVATAAGIPSAGLENLGGAVGYYLALAIVCPLGLAGWVLPAVMLGAGIALFIGRQVDKPILKANGALAFAMMLAILLAGRDGAAGFRDITPFSAGGVFGATVSPSLDAAFGGSGRLLIVGFGLLVSLLLVTEWLFSQMLIRGLLAAEEFWQRLREQLRARWRQRFGPAIAVGGAAVDGGTMDEAGGSDGAAVAEDSDEAGVEAASKPKSRRRRRRQQIAEEREAVRATNAPEAPAAPAEPAADEGGAASDAGPAEAEAVEAAPAPLDPAAEQAAVEAALQLEPEDAADEPAGEAPAGKGRGRSRVAADAESATSAAAAGEDAAAVDASSAAAPAAADSASDGAAPKRPPVRIQITRKKPTRRKKRKKSVQSNLPFDEAYPFPPFELFREAVQEDLGETAEALSRGGESIVSKLEKFKIEAEVVAASVGPAVTQYELRLAEHIRVNKITSFESDLAAALRAVSVRVVAPIPGKDTVGIEVPNPERQKVYMRDLLDQFGRSEDHGIPLYLGKDVAGTPIVEDLARMPHLLIAGTTGSGKSVCINAILLSILVTRTPAQVKLILVDPKMVELQAYKRVPHLCCDVVTNMKKAPAVLQWAVDEMEHRYTMLSAAGVNHIRNYNRLGQQEVERRIGKPLEPDRVQLPYIVIVIDEFADLMNVAQNEVEDSIQRLAQKSRAVGMHVILATQRPSSEVITGIIKANLPCQIAFRVNRRIDSRVILDANGAEKLLGHGDMLYMPPGGGALMRAQGAFVADEELAAVIQHLEDHGQEPQFNRDLVQTQSSSRPSPAKTDELYNDAVEVVLGQQRGSATLLQRALSVGYTRATRLLELMEADGLVGPFVGSKSRDVLLTLDEWKQREEEMAAALEELEDDEEYEEVDDDEPEDGELEDGDGAAEASLDDVPFVVAESDTAAALEASAEEEQSEDEGAEEEGESAEEEEEEEEEEGEEESEEEEDEEEGEEEEEEEEDEDEDEDEEEYEEEEEEDGDEAEDEGEDEGEDEDEEEER